MIVDTEEKKLKLKGPFVMVHENISLTSVQRCG